MIKSRLVDVATGKSLLNYSLEGDTPVLVTIEPSRFLGFFKAATRTSAGTTVISAPNGNDGISLTDLIITSDKVNGASVTLQMTDGIRTIVIASADVTDAPCNIAIAFKGNWSGWQAARVELVTTGVVSATVSVGYYKLPQTYALEYSAWDALR